MKNVFKRNYPRVNDVKPLFLLRCNVLASIKKYLISVVVFETAFCAVNDYKPALKLQCVDFILD